MTRILSMMPIQITARRRIEPLFVNGISLKRVIVRELKGTMLESVLLRAFREHEGALLRFLGSRIGSPAIAADILYDLRLKLANGMQPADVRDSRAYLFSMAANLATDHHRVERRRREILTELQEVAWQQSEEITPERHAIARAELAYMENIVRGFTERRRQILFLSRFEGRSQAEIAQELGLGITTVYKELKAAMLLLLEARKQFQSGNASTDNSPLTRQPSEDIKK